MKLSIGIVGLPNVGKSTLFKALTKQEINIANYPFVTIEPNVGVVSVPDERVIKLGKLSDSKKVIPAVVEFHDIAGLVRGASKGEGLGNQFLAHIREVDAICTVLRCFESGDIVHVENTIHPIRDLEIVNTELIFKDLETVEKRLVSAAREVRSGEKSAVAECKELEIIKSGLEEGKLVRQITLDTEHYKQLNLLTDKEQLFLLNGAESDVSDELKTVIKELNADYIVYDLSRSEIDLSKLIRKAYEILNLISFFTTGEDESRAWTIRSGAKAPEAAGAIHSDFEEKFIRAEVIQWEKLLEAARSASSGQGGWSAAKQKGWLRLEGKEYIVQNGDVMVIRHG